MYEKEKVLDQIRPLFVTEIVSIGDMALFCRFGGKRKTIPKSQVEYVCKDDSLLPEGVYDEYLSGETEVVLGLPMWLIVDRDLESYITDEVSENE